MPTGFEISSKRWDLEAVRASEGFNARLQVRNRPCHPCLLYSAVLSVVSTLPHAPFRIGEQVLGRQSPEHGEEHLLNIVRYL